MKIPKLKVLTSLIAIIIGAMLLWAGLQSPSLLPFAFAGASGIFCLELLKWGNVKPGEIKL